MNTAIEHHLATRSARPQLDAAIEHHAMRRGGVRQRQEAVAELGLRGIADTQPSTRPCRTAEDLVMMWGYGLMSALTVGMVARDVVEDGGTHPEIRAISRIAAGGDRPGNSCRDLRALYKLEDCGFSPPLVTPLTLLDATQAQVNIDHPIIVAHELLGDIYEHYPREFQDRILGSADGSSLRAFWAGMRDDDPRVVRHELRKRPGWRDWCIPCAMHEDGVPFKKALPAASLNVSQWSSLLGFGSSTWDTRFLWDALASGVDSCDTQPHRWKVKIWDWEWMLSGRYSTKDPWDNPWPKGSLRARRAGKCFAGGYFAALVQLRNDIKHGVEHYGLHHFQSELMCSWCPANRTHCVPYVFCYFDCLIVRAVACYACWFPG